MPNLFTKIGNGANRLFSKITNDHTLMRKIHNTAGQIDDGITRVGSFLVPAVSAFQPEIGAGLSAAVATSHAIANGLEKATRAPQNKSSSYV